MQKIPSIRWIERANILTLIVGVALVAVGLVISGTRYGLDRGAEVPPTCSTSDNTACTIEDRLRGALEFEKGTAKYYLFELVQDIDQPQRAFAELGIVLTPAGCVCCDPFFSAYNWSIQERDAAKYPDFDMPLTFY